MSNPKPVYVCAIVETEPDKFELASSADAYHPDQRALRMGLDDGKYATKPHLIVEGGMNAGSTEEFRESVEGILRGLRSKAPIGSSLTLDSIMETLSSSEYNVKKVDLSFLETLYAMSTYEGTSYNVNSLQENFECDSEQATLEEVLHPRAKYSKVELAKEKGWVYNNVPKSYDPPGSSFVAQWRELETETELPCINLEGNIANGKPFTAIIRYYPSGIMHGGTPEMAAESIKKPTVRLFEVLTEAAKK